MSKDQEIIYNIQKDLYKQPAQYYIGYQNDPTRTASIMFEDLSWIRKQFGVNLHDPSSPITFDSLNKGRRNEIAKYEKALKCNCPMYELDRYDDDGNVLTYTDEKTGEEKLYRTTHLYEEGKKQFQENIDKGLFVLCMLV